MQIMPTAQMWNLMLEFTQFRADEKKNEDDLKRARKKLEEDLNRMGDGKKTVGSDEYRNTCVAYTRTLRAIDAARSRIKFFADKVQECIQRSAQGKLFDDGEINAIRKGAKDEDPGLYADVIELARHVDAEVGESDAAAAGKEKGRKPAPSEPIGVDWATQKLDSPALALAEPDRKALKDFGLVTFADVISFVTEGRQLKTIDGLSKSGQTRLFSRLPASPPHADAHKGNGLKPARVDPPGKKKPAKNL